MFKLGILEERDFNKRLSILGRPKIVSIPLAVRLADSATGASYQEYFDGINIGGTYKKTGRGRLCELDGAVVPIIQAAFPDEGVLLIHDLGASSGVTSLDFFKALSGSSINVDFTASDYYTHIFLVRLNCSSWKIVLDADLDLLQFIGYRFVLGSNESLAYIGNKMLFRRFTRSLLPAAKRLASQLISNNPDFDRQVFTGPEGSIERIPLIDSQCISVSQNLDSFRFVRHNIFDALPRKVHVIRAMNVLNRGYFPDDKLIRAIRAIWSSLSHKGVLIIGRSPEAGTFSHKSSIFLKDGTSLAPVEHLNGGTEIRDLIETALVSEA